MIDRKRIKPSIRETERGFRAVCSRECEYLKTPAEDAEDPISLCPDKNHAVIPIEDAGTWEHATPCGPFFRGKPIAPGENVIEMLYLGGPYSHENPAIEAFRFDQLSRAAGKLINRGFHVFSPVTMGHPIRERTPGLSGSAEFWKELNFRTLAICDRLAILTLDGWNDSEGLQGEIIEAKRLDKPIDFFKPEDFDL